MATRSSSSQESAHVNQPETSSSRGSGEQTGSEGRASESRESRSSAASSSEASRSSSKLGRDISGRKGQFLVAARRYVGIQPMGLQPLQFNVIEQALRSSPDIDVVDTVGPKSIMGVLADGMSDVPSVLVAKMTEQKASILHQQAQGRLIIERDHHLSLHDPAFALPHMVAGTIPRGGPTLETVVTVVGKDNTPIAEAEVYLFGSLIPGSGVTDAQGHANISLAGETPDSIHAIYVKPKTDYWSFYQLHPDISTTEANVVTVRPLAEWPSLPDFPQQQAFGWGQKAMRLDHLPDTYRGQGVKVAVIDSGAATTHEDLKKIRFGFDVLNKNTDPNTWNEDTLAHGSHCAGVIMGADNGIGIRGFAPEAEIHVCKLFPGGQTSHLIDALEYCIEKQIDVINLSLGGIDPSEALEQQILRAKQFGIACIVAAGNSGGAVQYPASSPNVLAVAAIGKLDEFPPDSYHSQTLTPTIDSSGYFSAKFTCFGPQIAVCAPGVAITSSVPQTNYAVWDGTSMAAPHVTGLAALVYAHHPDFQASFRNRGPERVERLFQIIKASARRLNLGDPSRTGFGLPDAPTAVGLQLSDQPAAQQNFGRRKGEQQATAQTASAQQTFGSGGAIGNAIAFGNPAAHAGQTSYPVAYDQARMPQQQWFGNQGGAMMGRVGGFDPMIAAQVQSLLSQAQMANGLGGAMGMPGFPFGLPPAAFGRTMW
ncbi:MAG: S8 family serine peptidase [Pseudomonadota bacterium]